MNLDIIMFLVLKPGAMKIIEIPEPKALLPPKVEFEDFKVIFRSIRYDGVGLDMEKF